MNLTVPSEPMLAKAVPGIPAQDAVPGGYLYEPKWDGFRCIVVRDSDEVELVSRGSKPLTRYFPEVVALVRQHLPKGFMGDAELIVRAGEMGQQHLDWGALSQRIHPAASRIERLSVETPAELVFFDLLAVDGDALGDAPFAARRARLEAVFASGLGPGLHLTQTTYDATVAQAWFDAFEGAGLDGVMAKPLAGPYTPGKRTMLKIKHTRTTDCVVWGYRVHKSGEGVGSLLLGAYDDDGVLRPVGGIGAFSHATRLALVAELDSLTEKDAEGETLRGATERSRFSAGKDASFIPLRPERVVEVRFDQLEGERFRHAAQFIRWRPDREPRSCLLSDIDRAPAYDLSRVLAH